MPLTSEWACSGACPLLTSNRYSAQHAALKLCAAAHTIDQDEWQQQPYEVPHNLINAVVYNGGIINNLIRKLRAYVLVVHWQQPLCSSARLDPGGPDNRQPHQLPIHPLHVPALVLVRNDCMQ